MEGSEKRMEIIRALAPLARSWPLRALLVRATRHVCGYVRFVQGIRVFTNRGFFGQADQLTGIVLQAPAGLGFLGFRDELSTGYSTGFGGKVTLSGAGFLLAGAFLQPEGFQHDRRKPDPCAMLLPGL